MRGLHERILVVDHEEVARDAMVSALRQWGYDVEGRANTSAALSALGRHDFALALVDTGTAGQQVPWLLEQMRRAYPNTCVVMATTVADMPAAVDCLRRGAANYLLKPVTDELLVSTVQRALEDRRTGLALKSYRKDLEGSLERYRKHLEGKIEKQAQRIRALYIGSVRSLAISLEAKDAYTQGHSERVAEMAYRLAHHLRLGESEAEVVQLAGRLHDIGKIGARESVLNKPGPLTRPEFEHIKQHPALGAQILEPIAEDPRLIEAVLHHHEYWDGSGYPQGLAGERIPLYAQILKVSDVFEALTSRRSYRPAFSVKRAREIMEGETGRDLPPDIAKGFFSLLSRSAFSAIATRRSL
jgi:putative nucleotidyltransferase with HDIG domain